MRGQVAFLMIVALGAAASVPVSATETKTYTYDALGRLVKVRNSGNVNNNETRNFCYDAAGNRIEFNSNITATQAGCVTQG